MVTGGSPMGLGGGAYPILLLHIFIIIEFELAGTKAAAAISQHSLVFYLNHLNLRSYIFFLHILLYLYLERNYHKLIKNFFYTEAHIKISG